MKGGFLVALDAGLYARVEAALVGFGAVAAIDYDGGRVVQLTDPDGRLFTLYERLAQGVESEFDEGPYFAAPGVKVPDVPSAVICPFECRWTDLAVRVAALAAATFEGPTWLLDGEDVVWDAAAVDPQSVRL